MPLSSWSPKRRLQHLAVCAFIWALPVCLLLTAGWVFFTAVVGLSVLLELSGVSVATMAVSALASSTALTSTQAALLAALEWLLDTSSLRDAFFRALTAVSSRSLRTMALFSGIAALGVAAAYVIWVALIDRRHQRSSRGRLSFLRWIVPGYWRLFRGYFDAKVYIDIAAPQRPNDVFVAVDDAASCDEARLAELEAAFRVNGRFLMCCHPHGLFGFSVWCTFVAPVKMLRRLFDRRDFVTTIHTLAVNFNIPFWREGLLSLRFSDANRGSLVKALGEQRAFCISKGKTEQTSVELQRFVGRLGGRAGQLELFDAKGPGYVAVLVPGGAAESVRCTEPVLMLKQRKGFVRVALETGAALVPVLSFGETELYAPLTRSPAVVRFLARLQKRIGVGTPLVIGRNVLNPFAPKRSPLRTVIGRPVSLDKFRRRGASGAPIFSEDDVDAAHACYLAAVQALFAKFQPILDSTGPSELMIE